MTTAMQCDTIISLALVALLL